MDEENDIYEGLRLRVTSVGREYKLKPPFCVMIIIVRPAPSRGFVQIIHRWFGVFLSSVAFAFQFQPIKAT